MAFNEDSRAFNAMIPEVTKQINGIVVKE